MLCPHQSFITGNPNYESCLLNYKNIVFVYPNGVNPSPDVPLPSNPPIPLPPKTFSPPVVNIPKSFVPLPNQPPSPFRAVCPYYKGSCLFEVNEVSKSDLTRLSGFSLDKLIR